MNPTQQAFKADSKESLFRLINKLTTNEKRYIKLKANLQKGEKNHIVLFNYLSHSKSIDTKQLTQFWKDQKIKTPLFRVKHYLYQFILKSLHDFQPEASSDRQINHYLLEIEFLFRKKIYDKCLLHINKAITLAEASEHHAYLLQLTYWKNKVDINFVGKTTLKTGIEETTLKKKSDETITILHVQNSLKAIKSLSINGSLYEKETLHEKLNKYYQELQTKRFKNSQSKLIKSLTLQCLEWYYIGKLQHKKALQYQLENIRLIEDNELLLVFQNQERLDIIENAAIIASSTQDKENLECIKKSYSKILFSNKYDLAKSQAKFYFAEATLLVRQKKYKEASKFIQSNRKLYISFRDNCGKLLNRAIVLMHITVHHYMQDINAALESLNTLIHDKSILKNANIFDITMFAEIVIHFDNGNYKLVSSLIVNFRRKFKFTYFAPIYRIIFNGLLRSVKYQGIKHKQLAIFQKMETDILKEIELGWEYNPGHLHIDLFVWLKNKKLQYT